MTEFAYKWIGGDMPPCTGLNPGDRSADEYERLCAMFGEQLGSKERGAAFVSQFLVPYDDATTPLAFDTTADEPEE